MDLDDLFDRQRRRGARQRRDHHDDHDDDDDDRRRVDDRGRGRDRRETWSRRAHPHRFAWLLLGGGVVVLGLALIAIASSIGLWGYVSDAYFAATTAILPASWHDGWTGLPGIAHVAMGLGAAFVVAGVAGELFD